MRTFERTHPWISFRIDLRKAKPQLWKMLWEAASKCEHIVGVPLRPSVTQLLHRLYLAKGVLATTAIECNTLVAHPNAREVCHPSTPRPLREIMNRILSP
jgi:hypothetical protein